MSDSFSLVSDADRAGASGKIAEALNAAVMKKPTAKGAEGVAKGYEGKKSLGALIAETEGGKEIKSLIMPTGKNLIILAVFVAIGIALGRSAK